MHIVHRTTCRVCGSQALTPVIDLGEQFLQGSFVRPDEKRPPKRRIQTSLVRCDPTRDENACGLLQLSRSIPPEILYSVYWYRSGTNQTMRDHLQGIALAAADCVRKPRARILDIGCNDGTLLRACPVEWTKFGVDPSDVAREIGAEAQVVKGLFPSAELTRRAGGPFDVITSIAMFYDLESPVEFARAIRQHLAPSGLWVFEMSYMPSMLALGSYDTICHEHLEYYSLAVIETVLQRAGLRLIDATLNDVNGGSIRCFATHAEHTTSSDSQAAGRMQELRQREFELALETDEPYRQFQERIHANRHQLRSLIQRIRDEGKTIHVYGASTKGNTILQFCGLDHTMIAAAADRNPDKHGAFTLGTNIPIISEEESRALRPHYYLVLPWHFKREFLDRERDTILGGTGMIFPLPEVEIVRAADLDRAADSTGPTERSTRV